MPKQKKPKPAKSIDPISEKLRDALKPFVGKHPADLLLEHYETKARKLLKAEALPVDLAELMQWHEAPKPKKEREQWLKNFEEHHLRYFPEDRGKVFLKPRQAALRGVLFEAQQTREAIAAGDPQAAAMAAHRLAVEAVKADLALYGEVQADRGRKDKKARGIRYAIEEELKAQSFENFSRFWDYFRRYRYRTVKRNETEDNGISIDRADFCGEVFYDPDTEKLCEEPALVKMSDRQDVTFSKVRRFAKRTVERYFYQIKNSL